MTKEETIEFVKTGNNKLKSVCFFPYAFLFTYRSDCSSHIGVALAIGRDGSSGGCIRLAVITKDGVQRHFIPGDQVPGNAAVRNRLMYFYVMLTASYRSLGRYMIYIYLQGTKVRLLMIKVVHNTSSC